MRGGKRQQQLRDDLHNLASQTGARIGLLEFNTDDDFRHAVIGQAEQYDIHLQPEQIIVRRRAELAGVQARLEKAAKYQFERMRERLLSLERSAALLGPQQTLERGYSITRKTTGEIVQRSTDVAAGEEILTRVAEGELRSKVSASENERERA